MPLYTLDRPAHTIRQLSDNRSDGHRALMSILPDNVLSEGSPRSDAALLWRVDADTLTFHSLVPPTHGATLIGDVPPIGDGDAVSCTIDIATVTRRTVPIPQEMWDAGYRPTKKVESQIADGDIDGWVHRTLTKHGFDVQSIDISPVAYAHLGHRRGNHRVPYVTVKFAATVSNADEARHAMIHGIGKAKNFGLGMLITNP